MNQWEKDEADYDRPTNVLVDFDDQEVPRGVCQLHWVLSALGLNAKV